jgi:hypothetical protein
LQRGNSRQNILSSHKYVHYFPSLDMNDEEKKCLMCVLEKGLFYLLSWLSSFFRKFVEGYWHEMNKLNKDINYKSTILNLMIISHGVTIWVFLMCWFKWTIKQFELLNNS